MIRNNKQVKSSFARGQINTKNNSIFCSSAKGQINQVFIFLMAIFVVGIIVFMGTKFIGTNIEEKCNADLIIFKDNILSEISSNNDYGSRNEVRVSVPCDYSKVCFIDSSYLEHENLADYNNGALYSKLKVSNLPGSFIMANAVFGNVKTNVFLTNVKGDKTVPVTFVEQIRLGSSDQLNPVDGVLCVDASAGYFKFRTEGLGRYTKLTLP